MNPTRRLALLLSLAGAAALPGCDTRSAAGPGSEGLVADATPVADTAWPDPADRVTLTPEQWKAKLTPERFRILRQAGTEHAFTHPYDKQKNQGLYACAGCGNKLFDSAAKFDSRTGWPSFYEPVGPQHITEEVEHEHLWQRTEVRCARCDGHLGHVFHDAPTQPTGLRYCINGTALTFHPATATQ